MPLRSTLSVTVIAPDFVRSEIHRRAIGPDGKPLAPGLVDRLAARAIRRRN